MEVNDYVIKYPLDAVHAEKFADLLGKPKTAVTEMIKANKLPVIELRDPNKPKARAGEKWVFIPEFNRAVREAFYIRPQRWELEALARGATVNYDGKPFTYQVADDWPGFLLPI